MRGRMLEGIKAVLFDLDGSLVDSMWLWPEIDKEYLGRYGLTPPEDLQSHIEGMSFSETAAWFRERFDLPEDVEQIKETWNRMAWEKYSSEVPLKDGVLEFLALARSRGILLGIATSNSRALAENIVRVHGLSGCFSCIMTGCDVAHGKPAPDIYLATAAQLKTEPASCLVFEDIVAGIRAGKAAGMKVCAVEDAYSMEQKAEKQALADYYIRSFYEITG